jgi:uncharacterized protein (DUF1501 family)
MKRRSFLKTAATIAPLVVAFNPYAAIRQSLMPYLPSGKKVKNRVLVLIELNGGNDGLNTVIPLDKYNILSKPEVRRDILIPENKILGLKDADSWGFHPSMCGLQRMYNDKLLAIVHGVGMPKPEFSHFVAKEIKYTALTEKTDEKSGWVGRCLYQQYPGYPAGYPLTGTDGPPAIRLGEVSPLLTQFTPSGKQDIDDLSIGISNLSDLNESSSAAEDVSMDANPSFGVSNIDKIKAIEKQTRLYAPIIKSFAQRQPNLSKLYPEAEKNSLADQLKIVARLIGSGLNTPVYMVYQTGYDTHGDQVDKSDTTKGAHARLLKDLSEAVSAFQDDLQLMGRDKEVIGMTFSEFGRRIAAGSYGTDHGTAETTMVFGTEVKGGMIGKSPDLPSKITFNDNLPVQIDFRLLYKTILSDWLKVAKETIKSTLNYNPADKMDLIKT